MGRAPCCDKEKVKRGPWSPEEDAALKSYVETYGTGGNWIAFPQKAGLRRCGKSCRLRWLNYLRPDIKHGGFTEEEDSIICTLYKKIGSRWSVIAGQLQGRTDNDVKNYWNTKLKKKLMASSPTITITTTNNNGNTNNPAAPPYLPPPIPPMKAERFTYTSSTVPFPPDNTGYGHMNPTSSFSAAPAAALVDSPMSFANDYLVSTPRGASSAASSSVTGDNSSCCNSSSFPDGDWGDVDLLMDMVGSGSSTDLFNSYGACGELVLPTYGFLGSGGLWGSASGECKTQQGLNQSITYS